MFGNKFAGQARKMAEAGDGSEGGSGGGTIDFNSPEIQKFVQDKLDTEVAGLKSKNKEVLDKLAKASEFSKQFEGVDLEKIKSLQKQLETNEEMRLLAEGKTEEVVARRVEAMKRDFDANLAARDSKLSEYEQALKAKEDRLATLLIDGTIREQYVGLDFEPTAMDDVLRHARQVFVMDENGNPVPRNEQGSLIFGKDGKTPITAHEWLEGLADKKPYLRRPSKGAGASGNRNSAYADKSKMTSTQRIAEGLKALNM